MVRKILETLSASVRGLHQAAYLLAILTLASQILALIRDRIFAHAFGAGIELDLYYAAFRIPDLVFALIASLASAYVLIPRIAGAPHAEVKRLLSHTASFLLIVGGLISGVLFFMLPYILVVLFPDLMASAHADAFVLLARILLLQPLLLGLSGIITSVTQVHRRFVLFALSPVLYNIGIIAGVVFLYPILGLPGIGIGVVFGALLHLALHIPVVRAFKVSPHIVVPSPKVMWSIMKDSVPRSLALSMGAATTLALTAIAARTGEGSISVFTLAGNLEAVPLALIGASYATAAFPVLAEESKNGNSKAFSETLAAAARHLIFWSSIIAILAIVMRAHIVRVVYGTGAFDWDATRLTAAILAVLIIALVAQGFVLLASRAFYASRRSWNPLIIQVLGFGASVIGAVSLLSCAEANPSIRYFFEALLRIEDIPGSSIVLVALGATIGQLVTGIAAFVTLHTVAPGVARKLLRPLFEGTGAGILGGASAYGLLYVMGNIAPLTTLGSVFTQSIIAGMVGITVSGIVLILLENKEFRALYASLRRLASLRALPPSGAVLHDHSNT